MYAYIYIYIHTHLYTKYTGNSYVGLYFRNHWSRLHTFTNKNVGKSVNFYIKAFFNLKSFSSLLKIEKLTL